MLLWKPLMSKNELVFKETNEKVWKYRSIKELVLKNKETVLSNLKQLAPTLKHTIIISIITQKLHIYSHDKIVAVSGCLPHEPNLKA